MKKIIGLIIVIMIMLSCSIPTYAAINPNQDGNVVAQPYPVVDIYGLGEYYAKYWHSYATGQIYLTCTSQNTNNYLPSYTDSGKRSDTTRLMYNYQIPDRIYSAFFKQDGYYSDDIGMYATGYNGTVSSANNSSTEVQYLRLNQVRGAANDYYIEVGTSYTKTIPANAASNINMVASIYGEQIPGIGLVGGLRIDSSMTNGKIIVQGRMECVLTNGQIYNIDEIDTEKTLTSGFVFTPSAISNELSDAEVQCFHFNGVIQITQEVKETTTRTFDCTIYVRYSRLYYDYINITNSLPDVEIGGEWGEYYSYYHDPKYDIQDKIAYAKYASDPGGLGTKEVEITSNGTYNYVVEGYQTIKVDVNVPTAIIPPESSSQVLTITENGFYDVTQFNYVDADIPPEIVEVPAEFPSIFGWIGNVLEGVMSFEIMPNFSLGAVVVILVGLAIIFLLLKVFLGG